MVGRITHQKDYYTFLKTGFEISKEITDFRLVIVGDGEQKNDILSFIEKSGLKNKVIITGWVNNPECYIKSFDIAVLTSKWEGFGLVVAEYLAAEKPVIASNVDGIPFIIKHGFNGFLAEPGNEYNFSQQIITLIKDKNLVSKIVENGKNTVKNRFSIDRVVSEHLKIFESLINKHNNDFQRVCSTKNKSRDQFISPFTFKS